MFKKASWVAGAAIILSAGLLTMLPGLGAAGSLDPSAAPAPTMKTLNQVPPTWSQNLSCAPGDCPRFELVLNGYGVLDHDTGLVWETYPSTGTQASWQTAFNFCALRLVGLGSEKWFGWHLPTVEELSTLVDVTAPASLKLPYGHPFQSAIAGGYWTTTRSHGDSGIYFFVDFAGGTNGVGPYIWFGSDSESTYRAWCVRGPTGLAPTP